MVGGCKHAVALLSWLHRQSEETACTSTECYWKRSNLSKVGTVKKFIKASEMGKPDQAVSAEKHTAILSMVKDESKKHSHFNTNLTKYWNDKSDVQKLSIHFLAREFCSAKMGNMPEDFLKFCSRYINEEICLKAVNETNGQIENKLWNELRYARITAYKVHELRSLQNIRWSFS